MVSTITINAGREHHVLCWDAKSGKPLWDVVVPPGPWTLSDLRGGYAAPNTTGFLAKLGATNGEVRRLIDGAPQPHC